MFGQMSIKRQSLLNASRFADRSASTRAGSRPDRDNSAIMEPWRAFQVRDLSEYWTNPTDLSTEIDQDMKMKKIFGRQR
jgi:hypothetical protein